jgi:hypothetical protein
VRRQISRSINALIAEQLKGPGRKSRGKKDTKRTYALTIILLPTDAI